MNGSTGFTCRAGQLTFRGEPPQRERVASSYTLIAVEHADVAMRAFGDALYSPGFTLARPTMEAVVKQFLLDDYEGDDGGWQSIPKKRVRVTQSSLRELAKRHPELVDIAPLWTKLSPVFNDFVHGGMGQLTSNPIDRYSEPQYPGNWFAWAARLYTVLMLVSSGPVLGASRRPGALPSSSASCDRRGLEGDRDHAQRPERTNQHVTVVSMRVPGDPAGRRARGAGTTATRMSDQERCNGRPSRRRQDRFAARCSAPLSDATRLGPEGLHEGRRPGSGDAEELLDVPARERVGCGREGDPTPSGCLPRVAVPSTPVQEART